MSEKRPKGKRKKAAKASVMGSLPSTRPNRMGRPRAAGKPAAGRPKRPARPVKKRAARPRVAAATDPAPRPVRSGARDLDGARREPPPTGGPPQSGTELVTTVVQAAGELAQIGLTVGGQILKRAVDRIPRP